MSNPSGPDRPDDATNADAAADDVTDDGASTEVLPPPDPEHEPATEIMAPAQAPVEAGDAAQSTERRFTAPSGFDAGSTQRIDTPADPATEVFNAPPGQKSVAPQVIPARGDAP